MLKKQPTFLILLVLCLSLALNVHAREGKRGTLKMDANGMEFKVYTYKPACKDPGIFFVFHGISRNADDYRDRARDPADDMCLMVFAPKFDKERFSSWRYQRGGIAKRGEIRAREQWTGQLVHALLEQAKTKVKTKDPAVYLFGHSAGGQFLSRVAAYTPLKDAGRFVVANPSTHVMASLEEDAPYGFGDFLSEFETFALLKAYLASPVSIYLGQEDTGTKNLVDNKPAMRQGKNRLERGRYVFRSAREEAKKRGWAFNWRLVEVPGVGHSSSKMLRAAEFARAMGIDSAEQLPEAVGQ
jgi:dienelactone hydrolase